MTAMYSEEDLLPLSGLQHLAFCKRRWALVHLEQQWAENQFTAEGELLHETAHSGKIESRPGALIRRALPLHSFRLGLSGLADVVEFTPCLSGEEGVTLPRRKGMWRPYPIEFKRSRDKHGSSYRIQLCAQALCLEEMMKVQVSTGAVFDGRAHRRIEVVFDPKLRQEVEDLALAMHELMRSRASPPAEYSRRCESCSLKPVCLPVALESRSAARYLRRMVAKNLGAAQSAIQEES